MAVFILGSIIALLLVGVLLTFCTHYTDYNNKDNGPYV